MSSTNASTRNPSSGPTSSMSADISAVDQVAGNMNNLTVTSLAKRPGFGTVGSKVTALVNYFQIDLRGAPDLLEYSFNVNSKYKSDLTISARYKKRIATLLLQHNSHFKFAASDYANTFISTKPLTPPQTSAHTYTVDYFDEEEASPREGDGKLEFQVVVKFLQLYRTEDLIAHQRDQRNEYSRLEKHIMAINIALARGPGQDTNMVTTARREKLFNITNANGRVSLGHGLDVYKGFFRSARLTAMGPVINLNVAASAMYWDGPLDKLITMFLEASTRNLTDRIKYLDSQLKFVRIKTTYLGREVRKTIFCIARAANGHEPVSANITFTKDGQKITVEDYFRTTYPSVNRPNRSAYVVDVGDREHPIFLPSDICTVLPGQPYRGYLPDSSQTQKMIKFACRGPTENMRLILEEGLPQIGFGVGGGPKDRFGLDIQGKMMTVNARMLPPPSFRYAHGVDNRIGSGSWNMAGKKFKVSAQDDMLKISWLELLTPGMRPAPNRDAFLSRLQTAVRLYCASPTAQVLTLNKFRHTETLPQDFSPQHMVSKVAQLRKMGIKLVIVLLPNKSPQNYGIVKIAGDTKDAGMQTVCTVRDQKSGQIKMGDGELANLILKINPKLGGVNLTLDVPGPLRLLFERKIMFIGADVVHPPSSAMLSAPSVASVVASVDDSHFLYPGSYRLQQPDDRAKKSVEFIRNFGDMCEERLELYRKKNGVLPGVIIVYRDGVADNMFAEVVNQEVAQLQRVGKKMYITQAQPKIVFMAVKKRGHTRFYRPTQGSGKAFDQKGNPCPGFIVDQQITSGAQFWDWFLVSHKCIQGTSRPAHYVVLHDDLGATADQLQYLTFAMCFLWPRATKSISIHPAARAADVMCDRAKIYLYSVYFPPLTEPNEPKPTYRITDGHWPGVVATNVRDTMFYI